MVVVDIGCGRSHCYYCRFNSTVYFKLRGLCQGSQLDFSYALVREEDNFYWRGFTGKSTVGWSTERGAWMASAVDPTVDTVAVYTGGDPHPLGQEEWQVDGDSCGEGVPAGPRLLSFTQCTAQQFACENAQCVDMQERCDSKADCSDLTDEKGCRLYELDDDYLKDKLPPTLLGLSKVQVSLDITIAAIQNIDVVAGRLHLQLELGMNWKDPRVLFRDLKLNYNLNLMSYFEQTNIWVPEVIFINTESKFATLNDNKAYIVVKREGESTRTPDHYRNNLFYYPGSANSLSQARNYYEPFICQFNIAKYPFDSQTCTFTFTVAASIRNLVDLQKGEFEYTGPADLTQYFVKTMRMDRFDVENEVVIKIVLGRKILNEVLLTYIPTAMIIGIVYLTSYFKAAYFEAILTVNLTGEIYNIQCSYNKQTSSYFGDGDNVHKHLRRPSQNLLCENGGYLVHLPPCPLLHHRGTEHGGGGAPCGPGQGDQRAREDGEDWGRPGLERGAAEAGGDRPPPRHRHSPAQSPVHVSFLGFYYFIFIIVYLGNLSMPPRLKAVLRLEDEEQEVVAVGINHAQRVAYLFHISMHRE
jgi:hypothetical protein